MPKPIIILALCLLLPACGGRNDNPGGYSDSYWRDRQAKREFANRPTKGSHHIWALALLGATYRRKPHASI